LEQASHFFNFGSVPVFDWSIVAMENVDNLIWEIYNFNSKEEQVVDEQTHF
jgi:hypothetical protein